MGFKEIMTSETPWNPHISAEARDIELLGDEQCLNDSVAEWRMGMAMCKITGGKAGHFQQLVAFV